MATDSSKTLPVQAPAPCDHAEKADVPAVETELKTYPPFPDGTLIAPPGGCLPYISANEVMRHFLHLRKRLNELQHRLGTPLESRADLDEARIITHALWNYVQIKWLWDYMGTGRPSPKMFEPGNDRPEVV